MRGYVTKLNGRPLTRNTWRNSSFQRSTATSLSVATSQSPDSSMTIQIVTVLLVIDRSPPLRRFARSSRTTAVAIWYLRLRRPRPEPVWVGSVKAARPKLPGAAP